MNNLGNYSFVIGRFEAIKKIINRKLVNISNQKKFYYYFYPSTNIGSRFNIVYEVYSIPSIENTKVNRPYFENLI